MSSLLQKSLGKLGVPTRLIDVGPSGGSPRTHSIVSLSILYKVEIYRRKSLLGQAQLHRIHNNDIRIDLETWIEDHQIKRKLLTTTSEKLEQRLQQILMSTLSKTIRDAITLYSQGLGLRYIWIDTPYNIQNSKSDWKEEAAALPKSFCTVVQLELQARKDQSRARAHWECSNHDLHDSTTRGVGPIALVCRRICNPSYSGSSVLLCVFS